MSEQENPTNQEAEQVNDLNNLDPKEAQRRELQATHAANFQRYLESQFDPEQLEGNEQALDMLYRAFCYGFNSGMVHAAGLSLMTVGIDLNELQPRNAAKEDTES